MKLKSKFTKKEKFGLAILGLFLVAVVYYLAVDYPVRNGSKTAASMQKTYETETNLLLIKKTRMVSMEKELKALEEAGEMSLVPDYDNQTAVMSFLSQALLNQTLTYNINQSVQLPGKGESIVRRQIQLSFACESYIGAVTLVKQLELCPYLCQMRNLTISPASNRNATLESGDVNVYLVLVFYERVS